MKAVGLEKTKNSVCKDNVFKKTVDFSVSMDDSVILLPSDNNESSTNLAIFFDEYFSGK